jgi:hypothetical protein
LPSAGRPPQNEALAQCSATLELTPARQEQAPDLPRADEEKMVPDTLTLPDTLKTFDGRNVRAYEANGTSAPKFSEKLFMGQDSRL